MESTANGKEGKKGSRACDEVGSMVVQQVGLYDCTYHMVMQLLQQSVLQYVQMR